MTRSSSSQTSKHDQVWLRVASADDADSIVRLVNLAFQVEQFFIEGDRTNLKMVSELFGKGKFLVAEQEGQIRGCVYLERRADRCFLGLLSVHPEQQRSGMGALLMGAAEEDCRASGARGIDLQIVSLRTELPQYYRHFGYEVTGTAPFPTEAKPKLPCYFIRMSKDL